MLGFRATMCSRQHTQACLNTSLSIRQEIQRFESVHPSIYALYDLVELVPDPLLAQQIRDHVVAIEGMYLSIVMALSLLFTFVDGPFLRTDGRCYYRLYTLL